MKWPRRLSLAALAVLAVGCGQQTVSSAAPSPPAPSRAPNAAPTPAPKRVLIAVTDDTTVRLVDLHGQEVAHTALSAGQPVGAGGDFVAFVNGTSLKALHANGTVTTLGSLPGYQSMPVLFSPDGRQWLWATTTFAGSIASSSVLLSSPGEPDRTVAQHSGATDHRALYPFRWTPAGPVYSSGPVGIGGYILFNTGYSPSWLVDPSTAQSTPLLGGKCAVADVAADGTVACFDGAAVPNAVVIVRANGTTVRTPLPRPQFVQYGAASFRPDSTPAALVVAGSPAVGGPQEQYEIDLVDVATGAMRQWAQAGLRPGDGSWAWLPDGSLIAYRPSNATGGDSGVYLLAQDGSATRVFGSGRPVGIISV